ncbi:hypothetical protein [uncultured Fusobacterium sp.]|uniref:hypothetical protein n=1 Tax=uncultured Fusobacterium sp. TaxID=159267 RepID=UPI0015A6EC19|nr:hypothetical protein [uncultured Fusobacterium sp.]
MKKSLKILLTTSFLILMALFTGCKTQEKELRENINRVILQYNEEAKRKGNATFEEITKQLSVALGYVQLKYDKENITNSDIKSLEYMLENNYSNIKEVPYSIRYMLFQNFTNRGKDICIPANIKFIMEDENIPYPYYILEDKDKKILIKNKSEHKIITENGKNITLSKSSYATVVYEGLFVNLEVPIIIKEDLVNKITSYRIDKTAIKISFPEGPFYGEETTTLNNGFGKILLISGSSLCKNVDIFPSNANNSKNPMSINDMKLFFGIGKKGKDLFYK